MPRSRTGRKPRINPKAKVVPGDALRKGRPITGDIDELVDQMESDAAHRREVARCYDDLKRYPEGHPGYAVAINRLTHLGSRRYAATCSMMLELKKAARRIKHDVAVGLARQFRLLLIIVFNAAAVMLAFWLLSLI